MIPFLVDKNNFEVDDYIFVPNVKELLKSGALEFKAKILNKNKDIVLRIDPLTDAEKDIILKGCLINYYKG